MTDRTTMCVRAGPIAILTALTLASACVTQRQHDLMSEPAICDTVPPPVRAGERVGGTLPSAERPGLDSGVVIGTVVEAGTGRTLGGATVTLHAPFASLSEITPAMIAVPTNTLGGFVIRAPAPVRYTLAVRRIGSRPTIRSIVVRAGAIDTLHVELHYGQCIGY